MQVLTAVSLLCAGEERVYRDSGGQGGAYVRPPARPQLNCHPQDEGVPVTMCMINLMLVIFCPCLHAAAACTDVMLLLMMPCSTMPVHSQGPRLMAMLCCMTGVEEKASGGGVCSQGAQELEERGHECCRCVSQNSPETDEDS